MAALSKEEYLKRYLSSSDSSPKKKRKKKMKVVAKSGKSLIIDDDVNLSDILVNHDTASEENLLDGAEENPLIFDEAGTTVLSKDLETIKKKEEERKAMWAPVRNVNEEDSKPEGSFKELDSSNGDILVDRRKTHDRVSPVRSKIRHRGSLSPDLSPPRERRSDSAHELGIKLKQGDLERSLSDELPQRQPRYDSVDLSLARRGRHDSPDMSPPRRGRHDSPDMSPPRRGKHDPPDMSPPRRQRHDLADNSPPKRQRHDSPDMSPLRRQRHDSPDMSPPRRQRHDSADMSPPRRQRHDSADMSPPRRQRHDSPDMPTHRRKQHESFRRQRHDFSSDQSPPRRCESPPGQMSPLRRQRVSNNKGVVGRTSHGTSDSSPVRRGSNAKDSFFDGPPSRGSESRDKMAVRQRTRHESPDQSPPRGVKEKDHVSPGVYKWERDKGSQDLSPKRREPAKTERKAGLHSAAELRRENELNKTREDEIFSRMSSSATGKGAKTVHRDKMGRKRDLKIEKAMKKEEERKKLEEDEKFMEWGKGLHQTRKGYEKVQDDMYEMSKPLARYKDDEDLDQMLKDRDRSGDPMLAFLQKKKAKQDVLIGKKEKPRYKGPAPPPNRFNIQPGYRWDGVDRSNGFEKKRFMMLANKGATREEAYKWSTEDM